MFCALPDNIGNKKYCTPWRQKVLTYDFQNYSSLGKEKTLNEIQNAFSVWLNVRNLKFERVFDGSQVMNIAFFRSGTVDKSKWLRSGTVSKMA